MTKRKRIPTPFQRILPGVIRTFGPRLVLIGAGAAALLVFFAGGSYVLSLISTSPKVPAAHLTVKKMDDPISQDAQVLGTATTSNTPTDRAAVGKDNNGADVDTNSPQRKSQSASKVEASAAKTSNASGVTNGSSHVSADDKQEVGNGSNAKAHTDTDVQLDTPVGSLSLSLPLRL